MHSFQSLLEKVNIALEQTNFNKKPELLYNPMKYTLSIGGKRIRPVMVLLSCDLFGGDINQAIKSAIGIELLHNFTLIHDDIMDNAPIRRGKETVYKKWNQNVAILSGDAMFAVALKQISASETPNKTKVIDVFVDVAIKVCEGQQYDMNFETQKDVSIDEYIEMVRLKTAVLLGNALKIGAIISNANQQDEDLIYSAGEALGIAFQLKDDLLDVFSAEEKFGKKTGGDIASNKKTFLYLKAFELANIKQNEALINAFGMDETKLDEKILQVKTIYQDLNLIQITETEIEKYYQQCLELVQKINVPTEQKSTLFDLINFLMKRDF